VKLFGRELNVKRLEEKGIKWQICYGAKDDLVEKECALAPLEFVDAEVAEFPRGHVAIATSWSHPESACALHKRFGENGRYRGPVRYQLDVEAEQGRGRSTKTAPKSKKTAPAAKKKTPATKKTSAKAPAKSVTKSKKTAKKAKKTAKR
jgi:hypothetical protein